MLTKTINMITIVDTSKYTHQKSIEFCGRTYESVYNNNYYYNETDNILLYDQNDDCCFSTIYRIDESGNLIYLGFTSDFIFDEDGIYELNSEL